MTQWYSDVWWESIPHNASYKQIQYIKVSKLKSSIFNIHNTETTLLNAILNRTTILEKTELSFLEKKKLVVPAVVIRVRDGPKRG